MTEKNIGTQTEILKAFIDRLERNTVFLSVFLDTENYYLIAESNHTKALSSITSAIYGMAALQIRSVFFNGRRDDDIDFESCLGTNPLTECKKKHEETIAYLKKSSDKAIAHLTSFSNNRDLQAYDLLELCYDLIDLAQDSMSLNIDTQMKKREEYKEKFSSLFKKVITEERA